MENKELIGKFVRVGNHVGMIDSDFGSKLGFIWSDKDSWTGELVSSEDIKVLTKQEEITDARRSAKNYLLRERASLKWRIERKLKADNQVVLSEMMNFIVGWLNKLAE